jgi:5-formyltetrahydrofolate cyclo-ligase
VGPDEQRATQDKAQLRAALLAARRARSPEDLTRARAAVAEQVIGQLDGVGWVAGYEPMRTEPGSVELLEELRARGVHVLVPVLLDDRDLDWMPWGAADASGRQAIGECDAVLAPALAVSRSGVRLGRGGGSYDRALPRRRKGAPAIALLHAGEVVDELPADPWDAPVDEAVTPDGFLRLGLLDLDGNTDVGHDC